MMKRMTVNRRRFVQSAGIVAGASITRHGLHLDVVSAEDGAGEFVIGSLEEPGSLSALVDLPHHFPQHVPQTLLFDSLTQFLPDSTIGPKLATTWEASANNLVYTFTLNPAATFHDGQPVTAEDVKFTFEACLDPATNSSSEGLETVKTVDAVDATTVRVTLSEATPTFLAQGGARGIVPKHVLAGKAIASDDFNRNPVGSGPYRLGSYTPGESIVMEAVPDHYRGAPKIGTIVFKIISDQNVILTQLRTGELSYGLVTPRDMGTVGGIDGVTVVETKTPRFFDIVPNSGRAYWKEQPVRAAVLGGIDRTNIVDKILQGHGQVIDANVTPASWAYSADVPTHPYDPDASEAALDAAGWRRSGDAIRAKNGQDLDFSVLINTYDRTLEQALLVAQQNLGDIGVGLKVERVEPGVFGERRSAKDFDALSRIWNPVYDPDQRALFKTGNFSGYSNAEIDPLVDKAMRFPDQASRKPVYVEIQQILSEDVAHLFLYTENELHAIASSVTGLADHPVSVFWNLPTWTIE
jgi:peptide/nickel transport system substrate-binding protein